MLCALGGNHVFEEISGHHGNHLTWGAGREYSRHALTTQVIAFWRAKSAGSGGIGKI